MHLKMGRFGKYMACTNDECKNTRKILRNGEVAPPKEDPVPLPELPCEKSDALLCSARWRGGRLPGRQHLPEIAPKPARRSWKSCTASATVWRRSCAIWPMRRSRIRKATNDGAF
ncbi:DNA topoisomerase I [Klebsiella michiganensis]|nr:DNA topoisomerase I [Klebsiella michiganensis]